MQLALRPSRKLGGRQFKTQDGRIYQFDESGTIHPLKPWNNKRERRQVIRLRRLERLEREKSNGR